MIVKRISLITVFFLFPLLTLAQMFSVGNEPERTRTSNTTFRVGFSISDFSFQGTPSENYSEKLLEVNEPMLVLGVESAGLSASALIGNKITGIENGSFLDLNLRFTNSIPITDNKRLEVGIPIQLSTGITASNSTLDGNRFNQTIFAIGSGGAFTLKVSPKTHLVLNGITGYGFSNSNGGFFGGSVFYLNGITRLNVMNLIGDKGLSIGYNYSFKSFNIDEETYDYELTAHLITLGIAF